MSQGNTRAFLDHCQHVETYYDFNARITSDACVLIKRDMIAGPQQRYIDEKSPDGRSLYLDNKGYYRPTKEELAEK